MSETPLERYVPHRRRYLAARAGLLSIALLIGSTSGPRVETQSGGPTTGRAAHGLAMERTARERPELEVAARLDQAPGNITITPSGRMLVSLHQFFQPELRVAEVRPDGSLAPWPRAARASGPDPLPLDSVLGLQSDPDGVVWLLDNGMRTKRTPRLVAWDERGDSLVRVIPLPPPATVAGSFANDLAIDMTHGAIYIADPAGGADAAVIVVDLAEGTARRVLAGHASVVPEEIDLVVEGRPVRAKLPDGGLVSPRAGVNPLDLDAADEWLYYGPMHGRSMYRVRTSDLLDPALSAETLASRVERFAPKPVSDGGTIDRAGNIYVTDIANDAVGVIGPDRSYRILVRDPRLSWPDAFAFGPDGWLYVVANQLHRSPVLNAGESAVQPPFLILRLRPLGPGIVGR